MLLTNTILVDEADITHRIKKQTVVSTTILSLVFIYATCFNHNESSSG